MATSQELFERAKQSIPGGVNSPVRAFRGVGGTPVFIDHGEGAYLVDVEGKRYIDYVLSWGPLLLGHAHPEVVDAVRKAAGRGFSFGAPTPPEIELAERVRKLMPSLERVRFVNSGTEATMSALRLARGATGRDAIVKFSGCYHGHADSLLSEAGSGLATLGIPGCPGVTEATAKDTLTLAFNDTKAFHALMDERGAKIAAVIVEPVAGNMGVVPPAPGFLEALRDRCTKSGTVLIFDEVMTGFRVAQGGAQALYKITPDLTCLGKVIGGGLPVGAYGGKSALMDQIAPSGPIYQAGTLSGNPIAMAAGLATLEVSSRPGTYEALERRSKALAEGLASACRSVNIPAQVQRVGTMMTLFFNPEPVTNYADAKKSDAALFGRYFHAMLKRGVYLAPSAFEAGFTSTVHDDAIIQQTLEAHKAALSEAAGK